MKTAKFITACTLAFASHALSIVAQGQFQNLNFESETLPDLPAGTSGGLVQVTNALPSWSVFLGTNEHAQVYQNALTAGTAAVGIMTPHWSNIIAGRAMVSLQPGQDPLVSPGPQCTCVEAAILQQGLVPLSAKSLQLKAQALYGIDPFYGFGVFLNGQPLSLLELGTGNNYTLFGAEISPYSGQMATLKISVAPNPHIGGNSVFVDSILFSPVEVPEPGIISIVLLTGLTVCFLMRKKLS